MNAKVIEVAKALAELGPHCNALERDLRRELAELDRRCDALARIDHALSDRIALLERCLSAARDYQRGM
jgi:hypothetical protein